MDNEVSGQGNQYDYGFRIYNPRLGRFLSVDPLAVNFPYYTPYQFSSNNPIVFIDLDGKEATLPENEQTIYTAPKFNIRDPDLTFIPGVLQAHRQPNVFTMQGIICRGSSAGRLVTNIPALIISGLSFLLSVIRSFSISYKIL